MCAVLLHEAPWQFVGAPSFSDPLPCPRAPAAQLHMVTVSSRFLALAIDCPSGLGLEFRMCAVPLHLRALEVRQPTMLF